MPPRPFVPMPRGTTWIRPPAVPRDRLPGDLAGDAAFPVEPVLISGLAGPVRIAAIGDFHARLDREFVFGPALRQVASQADLLLVAGDLTDNGRLEEFEMVAERLAGVDVPVVTVLGNHDRRCLRRVAMRRTLESAGVILLDGESTMFLVPVAGTGAQGTTPAARIQIVGIGGYGGGFWPEETGSGPPLHRATQAFAVRARREAARLEATLAGATDEVDARIVLMHYSPTSSTLGREPLVKYWMLGNIELARVIDRFGVDLVVHGHAHLGNPAGQTIGGTPVRNVAAHVIGRPVVYVLGDTAGTGHVEPAMSVRTAG